MRRIRLGLAVLLGAVSAVVVLGLDLFGEGPIARLSHLTMDRFVRAASERAPDPGVVVVDIDEESLRELGQWPWPRNRLASLIGRLQAAGVGAIGLDIVFPEPDRTSPAQLVAALGEDGLAADALAALAALVDHDAALAQAIRSAPVAVGIVLSDEGAAEIPPPKAGFALLGEAPLRAVPAFNGIIVNVPAIESAAPGAGFLNVIPDGDGVIRRAPLILRLGERAYPRLGLEMLRLAAGAKSYTLRAGQGTGAALEALRVGPLTVPVSADGSVWLRYSAADGTRHIAAADLLSGRLDPASLAGKVVVIGSTAIGLQDFKLTPLGKVMAGVDIQAEILAQLRQGDFLYQPSWEPGLRVLAVVLLSLCLALARFYFRIAWAVLLGAAAVFGCFAASWWGFSHLGVVLDPAAPAVAAVLALASVSLLRQIETEIDERRLRRAFSRYLAPALVDELVAHPEKLALGGETRSVTVMFCDIKNFSGLAEGLGSQELTALLNAFLEPMTDVILAHRGTIDKYIGDCIMAFWNAPLDDPAHAQHAVDAAIEMGAVLAALNRRLDETRQAASSPYRPLAMAIGINTGECCVGNMGSRHRFDYSLLGDAVNIAARLAEFAALHDLDIALGEETAKALPPEGVRFVDKVVVRGRQGAVGVFTVATPISGGTRATAAKPSGSVAP